MAENSEGTGLTTELRERLENLHQELLEERSRREELEERVEKAKEENDLTVLEASGDLWRGIDEDRPGREDTVRIDSRREQPSPTRQPTEREVLEAMAARRMSEQETPSA